MPKTVPLYTHVVSTALTKYMYEKLISDCETLQLSVSAMLRLIVERHYTKPEKEVKERKFHDIQLTPTEAIQLREKGFFLVKSDE